MTAEEIYIKLKDELTAENESSSSPERIFIKHEGQTICTLGMNRSHEIIFVEFKPSAKDLPTIEREPFVHPHPVEMLHDAGWRQAQLTTWEEAEKLLEIIQRSYKRKKTRSSEEPEKRTKGKPRRPILPLRPAISREAAAEASAAKKPGRNAKAARPAAKVARVVARPKTQAKAKPKPKAKAQPKAKAKASPSPAKKSKNTKPPAKKGASKKKSRK